MLNGVDTLVASMALRELRDAELLVQRGRGNQTYYQLNAKMQEMSNNEETPQATPLSGGLAPQISQLHERLEAMLVPLDDQLKQRISSLGQRSSISEMKDLIKALCACRPLQLGQLARILNRAPKHLRDNYLTKMIRDQELAYLYPEQPAHPGQAYKIPDSGEEIE